MLTQSILFKIAVIPSLCVLVLFAAVGNALTCFLVLRGRNRQRHDRYIVSLSIAELFMCLFVFPFSILYELDIIWKWGELLCRVWLFLEVTLSTIAIYTTAIICMDICFYLKRSFTSMHKIVLTKSSLFIGAIWVFAILSGGVSFIAAMFGESKNPEYPPLLKDSCVFKENTYVAGVCTTLSFLIPLIWSTCLFVNIIRHVSIYGANLSLHNNNTEPSSDELTNLPPDVHDIKGDIVISGVKLFVFFFSWCPFFTVQMIVSYCGAEYVDSLSRSVALWLPYVSSWVNPFIYGLLNKHVFRGVQWLCLCGDLYKKKTTSSETSSSTSDIVLSDSRDAISNNFPRSSKSRTRLYKRAPSDVMPPKEPFLPAEGSDFKLPRSSVDYEVTMRESWHDGTERNYSLPFILQPPCGPIFPGEQSVPVITQFVFPKLAGMAEIPTGYVLLENHLTQNQTCEIDPYGVGTNYFNVKPESTPHKSANANPSGFPHAMPSMSEPACAKQQSETLNLEGFSSGQRRFVNSYFENFGSEVTNVSFLKARKVTEFKLTDIPYIPRIKSFSSPSLPTLESVNTLRTVQWSLSTGQLTKEFTAGAYQRHADSRTGVAVKMHAHHTFSETAPLRNWDHREKDYTNIAHFCPSFDNVLTSSNFPNSSKVTDKHCKNHTTDRLLSSVSECDMVRPEQHRKENVKDGFVEVKTSKQVQSLEKDITGSIHNKEVANDVEIKAAVVNHSLLETESYTDEQMQITKELSESNLTRSKEQLHKDLPRIAEEKVSEENVAFVSFLKIEPLTPYTEKEEEQRRNIYVITLGAKGLPDSHEQGSCPQTKLVQFSEPVEKYIGSETVNICSEQNTQSNQKDVDVSKLQAKEIVRELQHQECMTCQTTDSNQTKGDIITKTNTLTVEQHKRVPPKKPSRRHKPRTKHSENAQRRGLASELSGADQLKELSLSPKVRGSCSSNKKACNLNQNTELRQKKTSVKHISQPQKSSFSDSIEQSWGKSGSPASKGCTSSPEKNTSKFLGEPSAQMMGKQYDSENKGYVNEECQSSPQVQSPADASRPSQDFKSEATYPKNCEKHNYRYQKDTAGQTDRLLPREDKAKVEQICLNTENGSHNKISQIVEEKSKRNCRDEPKDNCYIVQQNKPTKAYKIPQKATLTEIQRNNESCSSFRHLPELGEIVTTSSNQTNIKLKTDSDPAIHSVGPDSKYPTSPGHEYFHVTTESIQNTDPSDDCLAQIYKENKAHIENLNKLKQRKTEKSVAFERFSCNVYDAEVGKSQMFSTDGSTKIIHERNNLLLNEPVSGKRTPTSSQETCDLSVLLKDKSSVSADSSSSVSKLIQLFEDKSSESEKQTVEIRVTPSRTKRLKRKHKHVSPLLQTNVTMSSSDDSSQNSCYQTTKMSLLSSKKRRKVKQTRDKQVTTDNNNLVRQQSSSYPTEFTDEKTTPSKVKISKMCQTESTEALLTPLRSNLGYCMFSAMGNNQVDEFSQNRSTVLCSYPFIGDHVQQESETDEIFFPSCKYCAYTSRLTPTNHDTCPAHTTLVMDGKKTRPVSLQTHVPSSSPTVTCNSTQRQTFPKKNMSGFLEHHPTDSYSRPKCGQTRDESHRPENDLCEASCRTVSPKKIDNLRGFKERETGISNGKGVQNETDNLESIALYQGTTFEYKCAKSNYNVQAQGRSKGSHTPFQLSSPQSPAKSKFQDCCLDSQEQLKSDYIPVQLSSPRKARQPLTTVSKRKSGIPISGTRAEVSSSPIIINKTSTKVLDEKIQTRNMVDNGHSPCKGLGPEETEACGYSVSFFQLSPPSLKRDRIVTNKPGGLKGSTYYDKPNGDVTSIIQDQTSYDQNFCESDAHRTLTKGSTTSGARMDYYAQSSDRSSGNTSISNGSRGFEASKTTQYAGARKLGGSQTHEHKSTSTAVWGGRSDHKPVSNNRNRKPPIYNKKSQKSKNSSNTSYSSGSEQRFRKGVTAMKVDSKYVIASSNVQLDTSQQRRIKETKDPPTTAMHYPPSSLSRHRPCETTRMFYNQRFKCSIDSQKPAPGGKPRGYMNLLQTYLDEVNHKNSRHPSVEQSDTYSSDDNESTSITADIEFDGIRPTTNIMYDDSGDSADSTHREEVTQDTPPKPQPSTSLMQLSSNDEDNKDNAANMNFWGIRTMEPSQKPAGKKDAIPSDLTKWDSESLSSLATFSTTFESHPRGLLASLLRSQRQQQNADQSSTAESIANSSTCLGTVGSFSFPSDRHNRRDRREEVLVRPEPVKERCYQLNKPRW